MNLAKVSGSSAGWLALILVALLSTWTFRPQGRGSGRPGEFSTERALADVRALARSPHPVGSRAHAEVRLHIAGELRRLGIAVAEQQADSAVRIAGRDAGARVRNILARIPGRNPCEGAVLLAAHYDSAPGSRGASDDGAGVATLLETARVLAAGPRLRRDIWLLFTDAEESGMLGALAFVHDHPIAARIEVALNFEARGTRGPVLMYQTSPRNGELVRALGRAAPYPHTSSLFSTLANLGPNDSDATAFVGRGWQVLGLAYLEGLEHYHRFSDDPEQLDATSLVHMGSYALSLARHFGQAERLPRPSGNVIYFDLWGRSVLTFPARWAALVGGLGFSGWLAVLIVGLLKRRVVLRSVALGLSLQILVLLIALVLPVVSLFARSWLLDQYALLEHSELFGCADLLLVTAITLLLYQRALGRSARSDLLLGSLGLWALLALGLGSWAPAASTPWHAPLLLGVTALGFDSLIEKRHAKVRFVLRSALLAATVIALASPFVMSLRAAPPALVGVALALAMMAAGVLLPALLAHPSRRVLAAALVLGAGGIAAGLGGVLVAKAGPVKVFPRSLVVAYDADTRVGRLLSYDQRGDPWARRLLPVAGRGPLPAMTFSEPVVLSRNVAGQGSGRTVELSIRSEAGARCIELWQISGPRLRTLSLESSPVREIVRFSPEIDELGMRLLSGDTSPRTWSFVHCGAGGLPVTIRVHAAGEGRVSLRLIEQIEGLAADVGRGRGTLLPSESASTVTTVERSIGM